MKTQIQIVSYLNDKPWLEYCLRSIDKYAKGFAGVTLVVPTDELEQFADFASFPGLTLHAYERTGNKAAWHLHAQAQKCHADEFCAGADFVLHTDSDCVFIEPVTPEDYFEGGKPVLLYESYARIGQCPWQKVTSDVLKRNVEHEFMRRHPQVNPIGIYADLRAELEHLHSIRFDDFVLSRKPDFPWGFTEHNVIGAFAWYSRQWHPAYHWVDLEKHPAPHEKIFQFWSYGGLEHEQSLPHTGGKAKALDLLKKFGLR